jgi:ribonuclease P protein component
MDDSAVRRNMTAVAKRQNRTTNMTTQLLAIHARNREKLRAECAQTLTNQITEETHVFLSLRKKLEGDAHHRNQIRRGVKKSQSQFNSISNPVLRSES